MALPPEEHERDVERYSRALERVARMLVQDEAERDDLVQEAWLEACRATTPIRNLGAWLRVVLRHAALRRGRREAQRAGLEALVARVDRTPSVAELVDEASQGQAIREIVDALREPYALVVHLRFFEDLSVREIARRLNRPKGTVQSQLKRGMDLLRERLDERAGGERRLWAIALVLGLRRAPPAVEREPRPDAEVLALPLAVLVAVGSSALGLLLQVSSESATVASAPQVALAGGAGGAPATPASELAAPGPDRSRRTRVDPVGEPGRPRAPAPLSFSGTVRSRDGTPIAGARIVAAPDQGSATRELAVADEDGQFRIELIDVRTWIGAVAAGWAPLELPVAAGDLEVVVVDASGGGAIEGATVHAEIGLADIRTFGLDGRLAAQPPVLAARRMRTAA